MNDTLLDIQLARVRAFVSDGQVNQAQSILLKLKEVCPDSDSVLFLLAQVYCTQQKYSQAILVYQDILDRSPTHQSAAMNLAQIHVLLGQESQAHQVYFRLSQRDSKNAYLALRAKSWLLPHGVLSNENQGALWLERALEQLGKEPFKLSLEPILNELPFLRIHPPLQTRYYGEPLLYKQFKQAYSQVFIPPKGPNLSSFSSQRQAVLVTPGQESSFLKSMAPLLQCLDPKSWLVLGTQNTVRKMALRYPSLGYFVLSSEMKRMISDIHTLGLKLLYFWEVGTDAFNYFLGFFRLAKYQMTSLGVPVTSGLPQMDYFLSPPIKDSLDMSPLYSECLLSYPEMPLFIEPTPYTKVPRFSLGLPENKHLYLCSQTPLKVHPKMDAVFAHILAEDERAVLCFFEHPFSRALTGQLLDRLALRLDIRRVQVYPRLSYHQYIQVLACANVLLDSFPVCGGLTTYDAFLAGTPLITMRGNSCDQSMGQVLLEQLGFLDLVVDTTEAYLQRALVVAQNPDFKRAYQEALAPQLKALFFQPKKALIWQNTIKDFF